MTELHTVPTPLGDLTDTVLSDSVVSGELTKDHPTASTTYKFRVEANKRWGDEFIPGWRVQQIKVGGDGGWRSFYSSNAWGNLGSRLEKEAGKALADWANANPHLFVEEKRQRLIHRIASLEESLAEVRRELEALDQ